MPLEQQLLWGAVLCFVIPLIILVVVSIYVLRNASRWLQPDVADMRKAYDRFRASNPNLSTDQLVNKIIRRQAFRSGVIGAITSVGGLPVLPLGLTIDLFTTGRLQSETLYFIGLAYHGNKPGEPRDLLDLNETIALGSLVRVSGRDLLVQGGQRLSAYVARRIMLVVAEKAAAKIVPFIGLAIGFAVNYLTTQGVAQVAKGWYTRQLVDPALMARVQEVLKQV